MWPLPAFLHLLGFPLYSEAVLSGREFPIAHHPGGNDSSNITKYPVTKHFPLEIVLYLMLGVCVVFFQLFKSSPP